MSGFAAACELHARAGKAGSFVECICLGASLADAMLRVGLVLQYQLDHKTRDIPLSFVFEGPKDKAISERDIYRRAHAASVIDETTFNKLEDLYDQRNRVIHRYVIGRITTAEVLEIAIAYEKIITGLSDRIHDIEKEQIRRGVGITVRGPKLEGDIGRQFVEEMADEKHTLPLAKFIRSS